MQVYSKYKIIINLALSLRKNTTSLVFDKVHDANILNSKKYVPIEVVQERISKYLQVLVSKTHPEGTGLNGGLSWSMATSLFYNICNSVSHILCTNNSLRIIFKGN